MVRTMVIVLLKESMGILIFLIFNFFFFLRKNEQRLSKILEIFKVKSRSC